MEPTYSGEHAGARRPRHGRCVAETAVSPRATAGTQAAVRRGVMRDAVPDVLDEQQPLGGERLQVTRAVHHSNRNRGSGLGLQRLCAG